MGFYTEVLATTLFNEIELMKEKKQLLQDIGTYINLSPLREYFW